MANNRLYIRCKECKEEMMIAKSFGGQWDMRYVIGVPNFMKKHNDSCYWGENNDDPSLFEIYDENKEDICHT